MDTKKEQPWQVKDRERAARGKQPVDPREAELVENMQMDVLEYIHGVGSKQIIKLLDESTNPSETMAVIAYKAVRGVAEKNKATAVVEMDMDMMLGVTTDAIDMIAEVAEAAGQIYPGMNIQQLKEDTLLRVTVMHGEQVPRTSENKQRAATDLRDYVANGADKAFDYVNRRAEAEGVNPQTMARAGNQMLYGTATPVEDKLKAGVKRGLMEQAGPSVPPDDQYNPETGLNYWEDPNEMAQMYPEEQGIMSGANDVPAQAPMPLPTGPGIAQPPGQFPPREDPNAEIAPVGGY